MRLSHSLRHVAALALALSASAVTGSISAVAAELSEPQSAPRSAEQLVARMLGNNFHEDVLSRGTYLPEVRRPESYVRRSKTAAAEMAADELLRQALASEAVGDRASRSRYLREALDRAPNYAPVHWQLGEVRVDGEWLPVEEASQALRREGKFALYAQRCDAAGDTVDAQLQLARWCGHQQLPEQEKYHLTRALALHPAAAQAHEIASKLRLVLYEGELVPAAQAAALKQQSRDTARALDDWKPRLTRWRNELESKSAPRRAAAAAQMSTIVDPQALPALEEVFAGATPAAAVTAMHVMSAIPGARATDALVRHAVLAQHDEVRRAAAEGLRDRDIFRYAPLLLENLSAPIDVRYEVDRTENGGFRQRLSLFREGPLYNLSFVSSHSGAAIAARTNTAETRSSNPRAIVSNVEGTPEQVAAGTAADAQLAAAARAENARAERTNERVMVALRIATNDPDFRDDPQRWWDWWNDYNELHYPRDKPTYEAMRSMSTLLPVRSHSCFVAGTKVWTATGTVPIERVKVGDCVLAQDVDTSELAYKPVTATTVGPPLPLIEIHAAGERISCTYGHLFWVDGTGWRMARQLNPGEWLYTARGPLLIDRVEKKGEARCHNLIVPDFNTYFVTDEQILVHDINVHRPTTAVVPGLVEP